VCLFSTALPHIHPFAVGLFYYLPPPPPRCR
jgi:hypothetical protein